VNERGTGGAREGSLEAPTRHPLGWESPEFWDEAALDAMLDEVIPWIRAELDQGRI
jgi:hypothetical protein